MVSTRRQYLPLVREVALVAACFVAYVGGRSIVEGEAGDAFANADHVLSWERRFGLAIEHRVNRALDPDSWLAVASRVSYLSLNWGWLVLALAALWRVDRNRYRRLRNALVLAAVAGVMCYAVFPVAPPRLLDGFTDIVYGTPHGMSPRGGTNVYAAFPSFHVGWPALASLALAPVLRGRPLRWATALPPSWLAWVVIATGNHFIVDVIAGVVISVACWVVVGSFSESARCDAPPGSRAVPDDR